MTGYGYLCKPSGDIKYVLLLVKAHPPLHQGRRIIINSTTSVINVDNNAIPRQFFVVEVISSFPVGKLVYPSCQYAI